MLKILDTSKATGPDCINPRLLREAAPILKYLLCKLFNISLSLSSFPSEWKLAHVTPVFKKDSPGILKNDRPKTTLTSFPSSSALPNSFVIYKSLLIAESPGVKPD
jgi:hypothetical protein